jgi:hypothetical protein
MARHVITVDEIRIEPLTQLIASAYGKGQAKRLMLHYDIANEKLTFRVFFLNDGPREYVYDLLDEAVDMYNEVN